MTFNDFSPILSLAYDFLLKIGPYFLPFILAVIAWESWHHYVHTLFISKMKWANLQITIPKEIHKSPLAMEIVFGNAFHQAGIPNWYERTWIGKVRPWFSLEIVSIEGKVYFFVRTLVSYKNLIEAQIYAQFPQAEITEVDDYTDEIPHDHEGGGWAMWGSEFKLSKADLFPIKTYVDYGLDKAVGSLEEEQKIDPITPTIEFLGSISRGEQVWIQIMIRGRNGKDTYRKGLFSKETWADMSKNEVKAFKDKFKAKGDEAPPMMTKADQDVLTALERSMSKVGFDVGIRGIYLAEKDKFNPVHITGLLSSLKQYGSPNLNGFAPTNTTGFDYPWQDIWGKKTIALKKNLLNAYRLRSCFYPPYKRAPFFLTTEELATIFHFPGKVSETPTFTRIESKKGEPPANLPV